MAEEQRITPRKVYAANGFAAKLFGLTLTEVGVLILTFIACFILRVPISATMGIMVGVGLFLKRLARTLPERYLGNAVRYWFRSTFISRASPEHPTARRSLLDR